MNMSYKRDIFFILMASFFYMASSMLVTPLIAGFSGTLGVSGAMMGMIGGLMNLCSLFCRPMVGNLSDHISKCKLSFVGATLMLIACLGYFIAKSSTVVIVSRIINGIGFACCTVCMSTWIANLLPREKIGSGMGLYGTMNALAMAIAPAMGVTLYEKIGYRAAFLTAVLFAVLAALMIQLIKDKGEPIKSTESKEPIRVVDLKVIPIAMIIMLFAIPYCATQSFLVSYVQDKALSVKVSLFFPTYALILLVMRILLRNFFDKKPFRMFLFLSCGGALISIYMLNVMQSNISMFIAAAFMASGYGIMCSVCQSKAILLAGIENRGLANSTYYVGLDLGMTFGPILGGILYGNFDIDCFYPILSITVPLILIVYWVKRSKL